MSRRFLLTFLLLAAGALVSSALVEARSRRSPIDTLFPEQRRAVEDPHNRVCLWTTGQSGKSTAVLTYYVDDGIRRPHGVYWYFCLTSYHVEEIAWPTLKRLDREFDLGCRFQEQKLRVILPGGSWIRLFGFDRPLALDRYYGVRLRSAAIDEAAFSNIDLDDFCEDTLGPRLLRENGKIFLMSIPPREPRGLFDEIIRGFPKRANMAGVRSPTRRDWSVHSWTAFDNPVMRDLWIDEIAKKIRARAGDNPTPEDLRRAEAELRAAPWFQRNYFGERVQERGEKVYDFDRDRNTYWRTDDKGERVSSWEPRPGDRYVLGIDFGWDDSTAFSWNVYRDDSPDLVEVESFKQAEMRMDAIAARARMYIAASGEEHAISIVGDYAHKTFFEEIRRRYDLPMMIGEKSEKYDWIATWNADANLGRVKIVDPENSPHVEEMLGLVWKLIKATGKKVEQPAAPNDCSDAHLMAYRHAYHYLHEEPAKPVETGSPEWYHRQEERMLEELEEEDRRREEEPYG